MKKSYGFAPSKTNIAGWLLLFMLAACSRAGWAAEQPNIVFIFSDDHAWQAISAYTDKLIQTPNIDRIGKEGIRFENCYVPNSICGPSRAAVLTGKYSHANGIYRNGNKFDGTQWTFPRALQQAGYHTALIGKWHLGNDVVPQGFNHSNVLIGQGPYYNPPMLLDEKGDGNRERVNYTGYTTDVITDLTIEWLEERKDKERPFMLMTQHKAPHRPWMPAIRHLDMFADEDLPEPETLFDDYKGRSRAVRLADMRIDDGMSNMDLKLQRMPWLNADQRAEWDAVYTPRNEAFREANLEGDALVRWKYQRYIKDYLRCIAAIDENVGRLLDYLDKNNLKDNTIVVYCSDQGFFLGEHGWFDKRWIYEESLRTPLLMRWPGKTKEGTVSEAIVSVIDFAATFTESAGAEVPEALHGKSLMPVLSGGIPDDWRRYFYYHYYNYPGWHSVRKHYGVVDGRYKLFHLYERYIDEWQLIDLEKDPHELKNFYNDPDYKEVQARLKIALKELRKELNVPDSDPDESYIYYSRFSGKK